MILSLFLSFQASLAMDFRATFPEGLETVPQYGGQFFLSGVEPGLGLILGWEATLGESVSRSNHRHNLVEKEFRRQHLYNPRSEAWAEIKREKDKFIEEINSGKNARFERSRLMRRLGKGTLGGVLIADGVLRYLVTGELRNAGVFPLGTLAAKGISEGANRVFNIGAGEGQ